ncbi:MAG: hypothetical protein GXY42_02940 [Desulfovibrionales bacterium]|nr:hypothetical protein [Desulfovibrionales bacterium]
MAKHIEITIEHIHAGRFMSQSALEDWELRVKALEIALRLNPDLLDGFEEGEGPLFMC